jgi:hypothetical protein
MEADIIITRHNIYHNYHYYTFKWEGKKTATTLIDRESYELFKNQFPWKLKVIEFNLMANSYVVARKDNVLCINAICHWIKAYAKRITIKTKCRIIITAMIWNLAYVPDGEIPEWKHIGKKKI